SRRPRGVPPGPGDDRADRWRPGDGPAVAGRGGGDLPRARRSVAAGGGLAGAWLRRGVRWVPGGRGVVPRGSRGAVRRRGEPPWARVGAPTPGLGLVPVRRPRTSPTAAALRGGDVRGARRSRGS